MLSESSNTRVAHANCSVANVQVNKKWATITNSPCKSKALDSVKSVVSADTVENPSVTVAPQTVSYVNSQGSKGLRMITKVLKTLLTRTLINMTLTSDSDHVIGKLWLRLRIVNCSELGIVKQLINMALFLCLK